MYVRNTNLNKNEIKKLFIKVGLQEVTASCISDILLLKDVAKICSDIDKNLLISKKDYLQKQGVEII